MDKTLRNILIFLGSWLITGTILTIIAPMGVPYLILFVVLALIAWLSTGTLIIPIVMYFLFYALRAHPWGMAFVIALAIVFTASARDD